MKRTNRFKLFVVLSAVFHIGLMAIVFVLPKIQQELTPVEVVLVTPEEINKPEFEDKAKRIVETDEKNANEMLTEKAKYLSAKNNTVEKETQAKLGDTFKNAQAVAQKTVAAQKTKKASKANKESQSSLFGEKFNAYDAMEKSAQNGLNRGIESIATDKLENVEQSLKTQLNTKEYKYYGYYQRIKNQLNQFWQPEVKQKVSRLMTKGRTIASDSNNKVTKLIIVLNDAGTLVKVQVIGESGVRDLDDAAVEAFRQAAPFPNPPKGMVEHDGTIKIRWDFVVES